MEKIQWSNIHTMNDEEMLFLQSFLREELTRREHIAELVEKANEAIHELLGELCNYDLVDIIDNHTGEVLVKDYRIKDCFEPNYDWSYPQFSVRCGQRSE